MPERDRAVVRDSPSRVVLCRPQPGGCPEITVNKIRCMMAGVNTVQSGPRARGVESKERLRYLQQFARFRHMLTPMLLFSGILLPRSPRIIHAHTVAGICDPIKVSKNQPQGGLFGRHLPSQGGLFGRHPLLSTPLEAVLGCFRGLLGPSGAVFGGG